MRIGITGGTGFLGRALTVRLLAQGARVVVFTRRPEQPNPFPPEAVSYVGWDGNQEVLAAEHLDGLDGVVNLMGEPVAGRWTAARKARMRRSRVVGTSNLVRGWMGCARPPRILVSGSAVGFYGDHGDDPVDEDTPPGSGFLAELSQEWERAAADVESRGTRLVLLRTGLVLGREGGALARMLPVFRLGLGGHLGSGRQWMPWIHVEDWARLVVFLLQTTSVRGAVNGVGPNPATHTEFTRALGRVLGRPTFLHVPGFVLRLALGEMATAVLMSQRVYPRRAEGAGFRFAFDRVETALRDVLG